MNIFGGWRRKAARIEPPVTAAPKNASQVFPDPMTGEKWFEGLNTSGLAAPSERQALQISAVYACVNLIGGAIAGLPMHVYSQTREGARDRLPTDALWYVLNEEFSPRWPASAGWEFLTKSLLLQGNAYAEIVRTGDRITGLVPLHPYRVEPIPRPDGLEMVYSVEADPTIPSPTRLGRRVFDQDDILHVAGFGYDGKQGMSVLREALASAGGVARETQDFAARFFANSARPDYVLESANALSKEAKEALRAAIEERHGGSQNAHRPMLLSGGITYKPISMPLEEMQFLEVRKFQVEEIARIYGVPPHMIGHMEKTTAWGTGVEALGTSFVRFALRTHLNRFQNEINRKFFRTSGRVAEFDTTELERADTKSLFEALRTGIGRAGEKPLLSVNEARRVLNLRPVDGGDAMEAVQNDPAPQPPVG